MAPDYQVFVSFKNLDDEGLPTRDSELALRVFEFLSQRGLTVFLSTVSLERMGIGAYKRAIDDALDAAKVLIAVGTSPQNLGSQWVRYEWDSFFSDILSGVKPEGRVFVYSEGVALSTLPRSLRQTQCVPHDGDSLDRLYRFVRNALGEAASEPQPTLTPDVRIGRHKDVSGNQGVSVATLHSGKEVHYLDNPTGSGGMKTVHSTLDHSHVVAFFRHPQPEFVRRLQLLLTTYNPTRLRTDGGAASSERSAEYFKERLCWPQDMVVKPTLGVYLSMYPESFRFQSGRFAGKEMEAKWFLSPKLLQLLPPEQQGDLMDRMRVCGSLAQLVRRLNQAGLAHSDLSPHNLLVNMAAGRTMLIDFDALVVPELLPPAVLGTPGYMAPEQLETIDLPRNHPQKQLPDIRSDEHALAVLIYEFLLCRHPLRGPKVCSTISAEEDERLSMGKQALFIEHPTDTSNAAANLSPPYTSLGSSVAKLIEQAFVVGLHSPDRRPTAYDWESVLLQMIDQLYPCRGHSCPQRWVPTADAGTSDRFVCPFCRTETEEVLWMRIHPMPSGKPAKTLAVYDGRSIHQWHLTNIRPGENADHRRYAQIVRRNNQWMLSLDRISAKFKDSQHPVGTVFALPVGQSIELFDREQLAVLTVDRSDG